MRDESRPRRTETRRGRAPSPRRFGWPELALVVGFVALALLAMSSVRVLLVRHELSQRADSLRAEVAALEDENARLQRDLEWSKSDAGIERLAREQLGWAKPGESAVVIAGPATPRLTPTPQPTPSAPAWRGFLDLILGG